MKRIVFNHADVSCWVIEQAGCDGNLTPSLVTSIGVVDDEGRVLGGVAFHNWTGAGGSVMMHVAGTETNWTTRDFMWCVFDYPFNQLHVKNVIAPVPSNNERALKIDLQLGFVIEATLRGVFPDADLHVLFMVRERCKWLRVRPRHLQAGAPNPLAPAIVE